MNEGSDYGWGVMARMVRGDKFTLARYTFIWYSTDKR